MVKKTAARWLAVGAAFALLATGCSPSSESASTAADSASCADTETFCIGLVLEAGVIDDGAFNEAAWEGVQEAAAATGGVAEYLASTDSASYAANLDEFGSLGFDVVVASGVGQPEATIEAATAHPDTRYIGISQDMTDGPANATGLLFRDDEAGYAAGYLAGLMTKTGTVGAVLGPEEVIPLKRFGEGYRLGALAALETVAQLPGAGTSLFCIGIDVDQYETVPNARPCLLSSAEKLIANGLSDLIIAIHAGESPARNVDGEIGLAPYHDVEGQVPDSVKEQITAVVTGLVDGSIDPGVTL